MSRKIQIFVSSTYADLVNERRVAVETIMRAGHIPAGMELFAAGHESQIEVINAWIDESDVFMLILGGRYGTVEPITKKSYTELEYERALATGKKLFAVVLHEDYIEKKVRDGGSEMTEGVATQELKKFRRRVLSRMCRIVHDLGGIQAGIHETLQDFQRKHAFDGWIRGSRAALTERPVLTSDERAVGSLRRAWHHYHVTYRKGCRVWRYKLYDFSGHNVPGVIEHDIEVDGPHDSWHAYRLEVFARGERVVIAQRALQSTERTVIQVFPRLLARHLFTSAGVSLMEDWDGNEILTECIMSRVLLPEGIATLSPGDVPKEVEGALDEIWADGVKNLRLFGGVPDGVR